MYKFDKYIHTGMIVESDNGEMLLHMYDVKTPGELGVWVDTHLRKNIVYEMSSLTQIVKDNKYNDCSRALLMRDYLEYLNYKSGILNISESTPDDIVKRNTAWFIHENQYYWFNFNENGLVMEGPCKNIDVMKQDVLEKWNFLNDCTEVTFNIYDKEITCKTTEEYYDIIESDVVLESFTPKIIPLEEKMKFPKDITGRDDNLMIMFDDILQDYIMINPWALNKDKLYDILDSKDIENELLEYFYDVTTSNENDIFNNNASFVVMKDYCFKTKNITKYNKEIWSRLVPDFKSVNRQEWIKRRIKDLEKIEKVIDKVMIAAFKLYGKSVLEAKIQLGNATLADKGYTLSIYMDNETTSLYKEIVSKDNDTLVFNFNTFGGCRVYISNTVYDVENTKLYAHPSKYVIRAMHYDLIIVTHGHGKGKGNKWLIDPVYINGHKYNNMYDIISNAHNNGNRKILLMVCNPENVNVKDWKKFKNVDVTFIHDEGGEGYNAISEGTLVKFQDNNNLKKWEAYIEYLQYKYTMFEKEIPKKLLNIKILAHPNKIRILTINDGIKFTTVKINSINEFFKVWKNVFNDIIMVYKRLVYFENMLKYNFINLDDNEMKKVANEAYVWDVLNDTFPVLAIRPHNNLCSESFTLEDCITDIFYYDNFMTTRHNTLYRIFRTDDLDHPLEHFSLNELCKKIYERYQVDCNEVEYATVLEYGKGNEEDHFQGIDKRVFTSGVIKKLRKNFDTLIENGKDYYYPGNADDVFPISPENVRYNPYYLAEASEEVKDRIMTPSGAELLFVLNPRKSFMDRYDEIHKVLQEDSKNNNIEGMKNNLGLMFSLITEIERSKKYRFRDKVAVKARAFAINDFKTYLKIVQEKDKNFDFMKFYEENHYGKTIINVNPETIKALKQLFKSIIL